MIVIGLGLYFTQSFMRLEKANEKKTLLKDLIAPVNINPKNQTTPSSKVVIKKANHDSHDHGNSDEGYEVKVVDIPTDSNGQSLLELGEILEKFATVDVDVNALRNSLTSSGLEVVATKDTNPYTGSMTVIRTNNVLPGTRYFHAQVFTDENGTPFVQHMSFEYRPSENAFAEAVAAAKRSFGLTKVADVRKDGFYSWNTDDGYIIWVKRMNKEDFVNDPFNAYTDKDIGTIKVAKEIEIH